MQKFNFLLFLVVSLVSLCLSFPSGIASVTKDYSFILKFSTNGGYDRVTIRESYRLSNEPRNKIKQIEYYSDGILIEKFTIDNTNTSNQLNKFDFKLANPDKRTTLQPVKHKWAITTDEGIITEERTLYVFEKDIYEGYDTFVEAYDSEPKDTLDKQKARFKYREASNKQPPVVSISQGEYNTPFVSHIFTEVHGVDNGRITKVEYYVDGDLVQTYTGELPHLFEVLNPKKKPIGAFLDLSFKVYDDEGNPTEVPAFGRVKKDTRTEFHDDKWLYLEKKWMYIKKK